MAYVLMIIWKSYCFPTKITNMLPWLQRNKSRLYINVLAVKSERYFTRCCRLGEMRSMKLYCLMTIRLQDTS